MFKETNFRGKKSYEEASGSERGTDFWGELVGSFWHLGDWRCQGILWKERLRT